MPPPTDRRTLARAVAEYRNDPLGFVVFAYPWGKAGTPLEHETGPSDWQRDQLAEVGRQARARDFDGHTPVAPQRHAIASGHGIGKSVQTTWITHWLMSTRPECRITLTAGKYEQLRDRTWAEIAKWTPMLITRDWFDLSLGRGNMSIRHKRNPNTWFAVGQTSVREKAASFAGQHATESSSAYLFDEASEVPDEIWDVCEGGLTDGEPFWFVFGNPLRNTGRFHDCFTGTRRDLWTHRTIDSRTVPRTNKDVIADWIKAFGEDSDFVRIRVKGEFPRQSAMQFISGEDVQRAMSAAICEEQYAWAPRVLGVDIARFGDDATVLVRRQGLRLFPPMRKRGLDLMTTAGLVAAEIRAWKPDAVFIDECGLGAGVVDRLRQLGHCVIGVNGTTSATKPEYRNLRTQMWAIMREWLVAGASLPQDNDLAADMTGIQYTFTSADQIALERKEDMKSRGLASPDAADSVALTFAYPVHKQNPYELIAQATRAIRDEPYDPFVEQPGRPDYNPWN